jgi:threonine dehydratase
MPTFVTLADIRAAADRIAGIAIKTGLYRIDPERLREAGVEALPFALYVKAENEQPIGSFKLRGAYNRIAQLSPEELQRGVITYSSGNHAQGVAYAARALGSKAVIVMPENAPINKREATLALGAEVVLVGPASSERKAKAEELSAKFGYTVIPPYDDPAIIAGQATCGLEIVEELGTVPGGLVVVSPVSGGGLLSGISTAVKLAGGPNAQVWGAEPELAADAKESFETKTPMAYARSHSAR